MNARDHVREQVQKRLKDLDLTQAEFARRMKRSRGWASNFLKGDKGTPLDTLEKVAHLLEMDTLFIVGVPAPAAGAAPAIEGKHLQHAGKALRVGVSQETAEVRSTDGARASEADLMLEFVIDLLADLPPGERKRWLRDLTDRANRARDKREHGPGTKPGK